MRTAWTEEELTAAEGAIGHTFSDRALLKMSFTHSSLAVSGQQSNERLEFLGDAVLEILVTERLYHDVDAPEGTLTELRKRYVSKAALECAERRVGLMRFLRYAGGEDVLAIGSDFDGAPANPFVPDPSGMPRLLALLADEFGMRIAEKAVRDNFLRVVRDVL